MQNSVSLLGAVSHQKWFPRNGEHSPWLRKLRLMTTQYQNEPISEADAVGLRETLNSLFLLYLMEERRCSSLKVSKGRVHFFHSPAPWFGDPESRAISKLSSTTPMISFEAARVHFYAHTYNFSIFFQGWQLSSKQQGKRWEMVGSVPARDSLDPEGGKEWAWI